MGFREVKIGGHKLKVNELDEVCDPFTGHVLTGSWVWNSSVFLSEWIVHLAQAEFDIQGKTVLELGAGMGIPGLVTALLGAGRVILTDVALLLPGLKGNVEMNELGDRVVVKELVWGSDESWLSQDGELGEVDFVLMSDVFYDESQMESLAKTLKKVCGSKTTVWSASQIRPWTGNCLNELVSQGFEVTELMSQAEHSSCLSSLTEDDLPSLFAVFSIVPLGVRACN